ncbi:MAG: peptidase MA family metallohydrolase [bacterium]|jgi:hypothetical protein
MEAQVATRPSRRKIIRPLLIIIVLIIIISLFLTFFSINPRDYAYSIAREITRARVLQEFSEWELLTSSNFEIYYDSDDAAAGTLVLEAAKSIYQPVVEILDFEPPQATAIVVHPTQQGLAESFGWSSPAEGAMGVYWAGVVQILSPSTWLPSGNPKRQAMLFLENGPVTHEFAHVVIDYKARGNYPRWLSEGIAQYIEYKLHGVIWLGPQASFDQTLYTINELEDFYRLENRSLAYRQALSIVLYIVETYGEEYLPLLLSELGAGSNFDAALTKVINCSLLQLEANWLNWVAADSKRWH